MQASDILDWLKILAILFTGGWAVFLLIVLRQVATARVRLDKLQSDRNKAVYDVQKSQLEIQELDNKLKVQPVIRAKITTSIQTESLEDGWILFATVELENSGNAPARLAYEEGDPFQVTRVVFNKPGKPEFGKSVTLPVPQARDPKDPALSTILRAGGQESLPFVVRLEHAGLYLLSFRAKLGSEDRESLDELGIPEWRPVSWTAKHYVWVE